MVNDMYKDLPWVQAGLLKSPALQTYPNPSFLLQNTIDESQRLVLHRLHDQNFCSDMKLRPLCSLVEGGARAFIESHLELLNGFDSHLGLLDSEAVTRFPLWGTSDSDMVDICKAAEDLAVFKYIQGRLLIAGGRSEEALKCAVDLLSFCDSLYRSGHSDGYTSGLCVQNLALLLIDESSRVDGASLDSALNAVESFGSLLTLDNYLIAFISPIAFRAIDFLRTTPFATLSNNQLCIAMRGFARAEWEGNIEASWMPSKHPEGYCGKLAWNLGRISRPPGRQGSRPSLAIEKCARRLGDICRDYINYNYIPARKAREYLSTLPYDLLPPAWRDAILGAASNESDIIRLALNAVPTLADVIFEFFSSMAMLKEVRRSGFFFYYPKSQCIGLSATLGVRSFYLRHARIPLNFQEVVSDGILSSIPVDIWTGEPLEYHNGDNAVLAASAGAELKHWMPPVETLDEIRWPV